MSPRLLPVLVAFALVINFCRAANVSRPEVRDGRLTLTLFAAEPEIVTPIGVAVDGKGRVFVLESHTHFPKTNYPGPKFDRVKVFQGANADGRAGKVSIFHDGLHHGMNLAFGPEGCLYATHRNGLVRLDDVDGDGACDRRVDLLMMDTPGTYPHNGIGGLAFSPDGWIYVGQGENLGERFTLKGTDGRSFSDREGGFIFRCRPDGTQLEPVASGFWNPFGLAFYGREFLLAIDNDPDSRPPNRLLDIVWGGDYGFKFRFGRTGLHPFQAWNGELPGTLPMVSGVGEGSSAVMACDRTGFGARYRDAVLVTGGWDHRVEVYRPKAFGASLRAEREVLVEGDGNFRPIGLATAPDGAVFFTDWVDVSYNVHGKGRVWRLAAKNGNKAGTPLTLKPNAERRRMNRLLEGGSAKELLAELSDRDPFIVSGAVTTLAQERWRETALGALTHASAEVRLGGLLALRHAAVTNAADLLGPLLADGDARVRLMAVIWTGENAVVSLADRLGVTLKAGPVTPALLRAHGAAAQILAKAKGGAAASVTGRAAFDFTETADEARALEVLRAPAAKIPLAVRLESARTLTGTTNTTAVTALRRLAADRREAPELRAEAAGSLTGTGSTIALLALLNDGNVEVRLAAARALRPASGERPVQAAFGQALQGLGKGEADEALREELSYALELSGIAFSGTAGQIRPTEVEQWRKALKTEGSVARGRRVFFSPQTGCARCHRIEDQGGRLAPDLSTIARGADREKLMQSILNPSRDIPPQFVAHVVETKDGESLTGLLLSQTAAALTLATADGQAMVVPTSEVASHTQSKVSLMPEGLDRALTVAQFRDLMAFLLSRK